MFDNLSSFICRTCPSHLNLFLIIALEAGLNHSFRTAYCFNEENVWHLCSWVRTHRPEEISRCSAVFISNSKKQIPLWRQRAGRGEERLVIWDYHVVFLHQFGDKCLVYDLDSELPFPTFFPKYVTETFRTDQILDATYHRRVPLPQYLALLVSTESHVLRNGSKRKLIPQYSSITILTAPFRINWFLNVVFIGRDQPVLCDLYQFLLALHATFEFSIVNND
nr:EOG090X0C0Q [Artemia franciscana]